MPSSRKRSPNVPQRREPSPSSLDFAVVGIGASAGGLQAIKQFFEHMPKDNGMAFVIVLHLAPDHQRIVDRIIQQATRMPVLQVTEAVPIQKNHVYVISPDHHLAMNDGYLNVSPAEPRQGGHLAIDLFFRELADVHTNRAFCLVLSGTGSDGAVGLSRIKEQGGVTIAQSPQDAAFDGMPLAAIDTQMVDLVLPVVEMPQKLLELWHNAQTIRLPTTNDPQIHTQPPTAAHEAIAAEQSLQNILVQLRAGTGHDFKHYKPATVLRRIERRMQVTAQPDLSAYGGYLQKHPEETKALLGDLLIGVTHFFRDREAFEALERDVLPTLLKPAEPGGVPPEEIRVWSAGCSTGEEAYSLAMLLSDQLQHDAGNARLQIFATDIDERAITLGRSGAYPEAIITDVPPTRLRRYFLKEGGHFQVRKEIRECVLFARHNLLSDPPFSQIDLIVCRNLLIYLDREVQREILQMFHFALRPGGYLFLGCSESADACGELFSPVDKRNRIFRATYGTASSRRTPSMPGGGYDQSDGEFVLVMSEEEEVDPAQQVAAITSQTENQVLANLERELQRTRSHLQDTIEQAEVSSEELKASNEEMLAINEELRSVTEELETSKQALQSINEELLTVNYELKTKVEETDKINDYLTNLIASTDIATVFIDRSTRIKWFTPRAKDIFNILPVDIGRSLLDITHRLDYPDMAADATQVFESLNMIEREVRGSDARWYIARLLPYRSSENQIDGTVLTFIDITKRRAAEEELRLGEERMRLVAESTRDYAIILLDEHGVITRWNTGAQLIFGHAKGEAEGSYYDFLFTPEDRAAGAPETELSTARAKGRCEDERWHLRRDGSRFFCSGEVTLLSGDYSQGYVKIARDLTGHKRLHEEQTQRLMETQTSSHLKDEFFAVMSHELKHPLNLIQLNAELLRRLPVTRTASAAVRAVNTICEAVASQARIIDDLLDVARVRTGKLKLKRQPVDLARMLQDIYTVVINDNHPNKVTLQLPEATSGALIVDVDPTRLEQIVWNLVNNALKFTPNGGRVQLIASRDEHLARLDVKDSGVGIAAEHLSEVFDLFGQAETQHATHQREGLGIGLSLVRQLTEAHGGSVEVKSEGLGKGCTFTIRLPLSNATIVSKPQACEEQSGRLSGLTVLLVDDSPDVLDTLKLLLEMEDANVLAFDQPLQALEAARDARFDVVISDLGMPVMNGHELMMALRELPHIKNIPAIALTGYGASIDLHKSQQSGFDQHIGKPVSYDELIETIEQLRRSQVY